MDSQKHSITTFLLVLSQGTILYADMIWRLATQSTPDHGFVAILSMIFYFLFALHHKYYSIDVIRMGQTGFYLVEWASAMHSLQYWYEPVRHDILYIVSYGAFMTTAFLAAIFIHYEIKAEKDEMKPISSPMVAFQDPTPQGNIQHSPSSFAPLRSLYNPGKVEPYQQIV